MIISIMESGTESMELIEALRSPDGAAAVSKTLLLVLVFG